MCRTARCPSPSTRSTRASTRSCARRRRPRRRSWGSWCSARRRRPGSRPRTSTGRLPARPCRRGRCTPWRRVPGARPVGVVSLLDRGRGGVAGLVEAGQDDRLPAPPGTPSRVAAGLVREERRDRHHMTLLHAAEASSPRSARIAPRRGRRIAGADVVAGDSDVEDEEDDEDQRERGRGADPGRAVDVGPARRRRVTAVLIAHAGAFGRSRCRRGAAARQRSSAPPMTTPARKVRARSISLTEPTWDRRRGRTRGRNRQGSPGAGVDQTSAPSCPQASAGGGA